MCPKFDTFSAIERSTPPLIFSGQSNIFSANYPYSLLNFSMKIYRKKHKNRR